MKKKVYVKSDLYYLIKNKSEKAPKKINLFCRNSSVTPNTLGQILYIHNGKTFLKVYVTENIMGHKLGEFSSTRKAYLFKKGKKQKNKK